MMRLNTFSMIKINTKLPTKKIQKNNQLNWKTTKKLPPHNYLFQSTTNFNIKRYYSSAEQDDDDEIELTPRQERMLGEIESERSNYKIKQMGYKTVFMVEEDGGALGLMKVEDAVALARSQDKDLVMIGAKRDPPVCKVVDLVQHVISLTTSHDKTKGMKMKSMTVSSNITENDLTIKMKKIEKFLKKGHKCSIAVYFRSLDNVNKPLGLAILKNIAERLADVLNDKAEPIYKELTNEVQMLIEPLPKYINQNKVREKKEYPDRRQKAPSGERAILRQGLKRIAKAKDLNILTLPKEDIEYLYEKLTFCTELRQDLKRIRQAESEEDRPEDWYGEDGSGYDDETPKKKSRRGGMKVIQREQDNISHHYKHLYE